MNTNRFTSLREAKAALTNLIKRNPIYKACFIEDDYNECDDVYCYRIVGL